MTSNIGMIGTAMDPADVLHNALECKRVLEGWWLDEGGFQPETIDNVAVLFSDAVAREAFHMHLSSHGWTEFNDSTDHVVGHLSREDYDVEFVFWRDPDDEGFRIETMLLNPAESDLHRALLETYGQGAIAQGSYKPQGVNSRAEYQDENRFLMGWGWEVVECFQSTYGPYTYFSRLGIHDLRLGYLKVRLNERDA